VAALELSPLDLEGRSMQSIRALRTMYHPQDMASYRQLQLKCQKHVQKIVREAEQTGMAVSPFHSNVHQWLRNVQRMRFRCNPLANGWADMVENEKAPEDGYDCIKIERVFSTDRFLLISDRVVMRGPSSIAPFGPPIASFFTPAWPPTPRMLLHSTFISPESCPRAKIKEESAHFSTKRIRTSSPVPLLTQKSNNVASSTSRNPARSVEEYIDPTGQNSGSPVDEIVLWNCLLDLMEAEERGGQEEIKTACAPLSIARRKISTHGCDEDASNFIFSTLER
jgi:hypothetical protein